MKTCYIYTRSATHDASENSSAFTRQETACRKYTAQNGYKILQTFSDPLTPGNSLERDGLNTLLKTCESYPVKAVIVSSIDRLTRNVLDFCTLLKKFKEKNIRLVSTIEGDICENYFVTSLLIGVSQWQAKWSKTK